MVILDTIELMRGTAVIRYVKGYANFTDTANALTYSAFEFEVDEPDFAVGSVPQMTITLPNISDSVRNWIEVYSSSGSLVATFRRYEDQAIVKSITFPVVKTGFTSNAITLLAEPVNINDLNLHKLMYTTTVFKGLAA